jgi:RNA polymerase sigma factor (sigma-70 family)
MTGGPEVMVLVRQAAAGDRNAWDQVVDRYAPLVWSICRRYRLTQADAEDVSQSVWLRLVENLRGLRDPEALPGWLATTTSRECLRVVRSSMRERPADEFHLEMEVLGEVDSVEQGFVAAELRDALRTAYSQLPTRCQQLLALLMEDPPVAYAQISQRLNMRIGGIGPNRARCLDRLRECPALAVYFRARADMVEGGGGHDRPVVER